METMNLLGYLMDDFTLLWFRNKIDFFLLPLTLCLFLSFCNVSLANECGEPGYPDQYPYFSPAETCEGVEPIVFDREHSVETLGDNSSGTVTITGGNGDYTWSISGNGFSFSATSILTTLQTSTQSITVHTTDTSCGAGHISITDGCTTQIYEVRSTNGVWVQQPAGTNNPIPGAVGDWNVTWKTTTAIKDSWKVTEVQSYQIRDDYGVLTTINGYSWVAYYFDPTIYYNLSCSSGVLISQNPQHEDNRIFLETFYNPIFPKSASYPTLYPIALEKLDGYYIPGGVFLARIRNNESGWIGTYTNGTPTTSMRCGYNLGSPTGTRYILDSYAQGYWWFDIVGYIQSVHKWECH